MAGRGTDAITPARRRRLAAGIAVVLVALWFARRPIAQHFVDRELAKRGVPARYKVADLGLGRQRLTDVVIGDPARPDLVADWIETDTAVGLSGARLSGVRAGRVRVRGRLVDGRLSLGSLDRLLPASRGGAFALPALSVEVADARMALATPAGEVSLRLRDGYGRLDSGFAGRFDAAAARLVAGSCRIEQARAVTTLSTRAGRPTLAGRLAAADATCAAGARLRSPTGAFTLTLGEHLDRWQGQASQMGAAAATLPGVASIAGPRADIAFAGDARRTEGTIDAATDALGWNEVATGQRARLAGRFAIGDDGSALDAEAWVGGAALDAALRRRVVRAVPPLAGTPAAALAGRLAQAGEAALRRFDLRTAVSVAQRGGVTAARVRRATLSAASGARAVLAGGKGVVLDSRHGVGRVATRLAVTGGGLPGLNASLRRDGAGQPLTGEVAPTNYAAGNARLALADTRFRLTPAGGFDLTTAATLTGPLGDGEVRAVTAPVAVRARGGQVAVNPGCTPVSWQRIASGGLVLDPATLRLCATGPALLTIADGRLGGGGARVATTRLAGRLGSSALDLRLGGATLALAGRDAVIRDVALRLGDPARPVRIEAARLDGRATADGLAGRFAGAGGQVGAVPLILSGGSGTWRLAGGRLALAGALQVEDAAAPARFQPLAAQEVTLRLANGAIHAEGTLAEPATGTRVATVAIDHALGSGRGTARLDVPRIDFIPAFQPERLTRLTYGVIADVRGTASGEARIGWGPDGVTSTGTFRTAGTDLAAAFGPVTGLATEIRFTDLLALQSAPGQVATVATINPGIPVENGVVRYQTLADARVRVEGARWPFAGGTLTLEPTLLDFGGEGGGEGGGKERGERRLTFDVDGVAADRFLQQFDFKNIDATGIFDGKLPMVFDDAGGRIEGGRLVVRPGGGSLAYVGEVSRRNLGFWGNLAFGALRSLRYRDLSIAMNGPLAGEMVTDVRFSGVSQGKGATSNFLIRRLQRLPFVFNVRITAPFRGLIDSAQSFYDPKRLIDRNLPALIEQQNRAAAPVQPPASEPEP